MKFSNDVGNSIWNNKRMLDIKSNDSVSLIASFDRKCNIIPLYFRYGTDEQVTVKILSSRILNASPQDDIFLTFLCRYMHGDIMKSIKLSYCCKEHFWYIEK